MIDDTIEIGLTWGQVAIIDSNLADVVGKYEWYAAWKPSSHAFYAMRTDYSEGTHKTVIMHRFIWELVNGPIPDGLEIDHINRNSLDNRIENLRLATKREQQQNRKEQHEGKTSSKYPGVCWHKQHEKWYASIRVNGRLEYLGLFDTEEAAHKVYEQVAKDVEDKLRMEKEANGKQNKEILQWHII